MIAPRLLRRPDRERDGIWLPATALRVTLGLLGVGLTFLLHSDGWAAVGILLSLMAAAVPEYYTAWALILFLAVSELSHDDSLHWQLLMLLAGVHLLHLLSTFALELPWRSWFDPAILLGPIRRFVLIQIPTQVVAVVCLVLLAPNSRGHRPVDAAAVAVVGALALVGLAVLLFSAAQQRH